MEPQYSLPHSQMSPPLPIRSQLNPVHTPTSHILKIILILFFHLCLGLLSGLFVWKIHLRKTEATSSSSYKPTADVTQHVTSFLKCWTAHRTWHLFVSPIPQVKTEQLALCKEKRWSHAINCTWGRVLFVCGLGESTATLVLGWLTVRVGGTLFCLSCFSVGKKVSFMVSCPLSIVYFVYVQLVEAEHYKPEGRGFDSRCCDWKFSLTFLAATLWPWGLTQPLTEMRTRNISWG
jgi:hypothetical protein